MMRHKKMFVMGLVTIFVATFSLFYVFDKIEELQTTCDEEASVSLICDQFSGYKMSSLMIFVPVGTIMLVIIATVYLMLSSTS